MFGRSNTHNFDKGIAALALVLLVILSACGGSPPDGNQSTAATPTATLPPSRYRVSEHKNIAYGPLSAEKLDLCEPVGFSSPRPVVLLIHGGGWTETNETKDTSFFQTTCTWLASKGFVVANINYRLATSLPNGQVVTKDLWPAQLIDAQLAVRWMRTQAVQLGLDSTRICAQGYSAGAQLAVFLGSLATIQAGDEASLLSNQSPKVSCVVDFYGPIDLTRVSYADAYYALFGPSNIYNTTVLHNASPIFAISPQSAPTLIVQGTKDSLVPPSQAMELYQALQRNHVPVQYLSFDGGHAMQGLSLSQAQQLEAQAAIYLAVHLHP